MIDRGKHTVVLDVGFYMRYAKVLKRGYSDSKVRTPTVECV